MEVGFFETATYPDGQSVAGVAYSNEFGVPSKGQPPRPFFRNAISEHKEEWIEKVKQGIINGGDIENVIGKVGVLIKEDIQKSIMDLSDPPLKESTILKKMQGDKKRGVNSMNRKDASKPLEHTRLMLRSVESKVTKNA